MKKIINRSRALLLLLAFIIILAPLSTLAETGNKKDINYVALGDSLTANQLHDGSYGKGFVPRISETLTDSRYDVHETNEGVPGYTTADVLADLEDIPELTDADLITISAGANDVLRELDPLMKLDPSMLIYLLPGKVEELIEEAEEAENVARVTITASLDEVEEVNEALDHMKKTIEQIMDDYDDVLPPETEKVFEQVKGEINEAVKKSAEAEQYLVAAYENMNEADVKTAIVSLDEVGNALTHMIEIIELVESDLPDLIERIETFEKETNDVIFSVHEAITVSEEAASLVTEAIELKKEADQANDFLKEHGPKIDAIYAKLGEVNMNMSLIMAEISDINPEADVYVMGYYNALPYVPASMQEVTVPLLESLNAAIEVPTHEYGATFIPTFEAFVGKYEEYLPNPADIHPSEQGYKAIATVFMDEISKQYPGYTIPTEPVTHELTLGETIEVGAGDKVLIRETMTTLQMPNDLPAGTTVTITETDVKIKEKAEGLQSFGDALHVDFTFPEGFEGYEGSFEMTMGYEEDAPGDVNIYYFNEDKEQWEQRAGVVNKEAAHITLQLTHFSNYGVFAKEKVSENPAEPTAPKEPSEPQQPAEQEGPTETEKTPKSSGGEGSELPKTSTHMFNWMVAGVLFLITGVFIMLMIRKRNRHVA